MIDLFVVGALPGARRALAEALDGLAQLRASTGGGSEGLAADCRATRALVALAATRQVAREIKTTGRFDAIDPAIGHPEMQQLMAPERGG